MVKMLLDSEVLYCLEKCNEYDCDRDKCAMVDVDNSCKAWEESIRVIRGLLNDKEKYRWHDLRKDPYDLPDGSAEYLVMLEESWHCGNMATAYFNPIKRSNWIVNNIDQKIFEDENRNGHEPWDGVIAWRCVEPFEG